MSYLCKKAVKLFGKPYLPGDIIPTESVLSTRVRALITCGYIADAPAAEATEEPADHNDEPKEVKEEPADHNDEPKEVKTEAKGRASSHTTKAGNNASTASQRHSTSGKG
nr:MAG: hypothetical protein [Bacteriophage sp.]